MEYGDDDLLRFRTPFTYGMSVDIGLDGYMENGTWSRNIPMHSA
jgi:hypothetical protein